MSPELITEIASRESTRTFRFGSQELEAFTEAHVHKGRCFEDSGWYVVVHSSYDARYPDFAVLSRWSWGQHAPHSYDVPAESAKAA